MMMPKGWRNNKYICLVCVDVFTRKADMEPMKDDDSEFTNKSFIRLLEKENIKIEIIYATDHVQFVESYHRKKLVIITVYKLNTLGVFLNLLDVEYIYIMQQITARIRRRNKYNEFETLGCIR